MRKRLDQYLADAGYFESRARAKAAVMEGAITVDGRADMKPGSQVSGLERVEVLAPKRRYVSRGGVKLAGAIEDFGIDVSGRSVLDVGASTGGFTDYLLQAGARRVVALDVGRGQLHWKLRQDERVTVLEGFNARELTGAVLPFEPDFAVIDVSFISLKKVIEPVLTVMAKDGDVIALVKPQFEAGIGMAPKGVVRDPAVHKRVLTEINDWLKERGLTIGGVTPSKIKGPKGNVEFFITISKTHNGVKPYYAFCDR
ncbi:MAG: TlyA family rRNA (cytidine-2'-O)-methyltransferase [Candidatus Anoxymicrobium japonicum]|uniref:TlyA family rRNA (Cytidine-2'-O)-methyltransferase n=1 Tax=Candidatus Anoxymicrobium japonicum TaxID=2013648 RepID=A0A2N3G628_9ACTN|nr:MAG: TlyA family rRNA (cytidine-2'-O)-methyltransferase [Candidatus Anoxymicrobium japonicum]